MIVQIPADTAKNCEILFVLGPAQVVVDLTKL